MYLQSRFRVHRGGEAIIQKVLVSQIFFLESVRALGKNSERGGGPLKSIHHLSKGLFVDICTFYFGRQLGDERAAGTTCRK